MTWLLWRQHRGEALAAGVGLALFAVAVLTTGVHMAHVYDDALRTCPGNGACDFVGQLFRGYGAIVDLVHLSIAVPLIFGLFLGATLIAREIDHATNVLAWTQTVTRRRWLLAKVGMALVATLAWSVGVSALVTWWSGTPNALYGNRFEGAQFDTQNVAPIAFALFAVCLGIAAGALLRRTLPALATTLVGYAVVRVLVSVYARPHYAAAVTRSFPLSADVQLPSGSWTLSSKLVDPAGHAVTGQLDIPQSCAAAVNRSGVQSCLARLGFHNVVSYHAAGEYWRFQWIEAAVFVALAAAVLAVGIVVTLRHDA
jgi:ABC-2 family transporter protein